MPAPRFPDPEPLLCYGVMPRSPDRVIIRNARQHNLKGITVELPRCALSVVTGPSGSGKSSLAFDTLFAEGQWRYIESLSTYARRSEEHTSELQSHSDLVCRLLLEKKKKKKLKNKLKYNKRVTLHRYKQTNNNRTIQLSYS